MSSTYVFVLQVRTGEGGGELQLQTLETFFDALIFQRSSAKTVRLQYRGAAALRRGQTGRDCQGLRAGAVQEWEGRFHRKVMHI